MQRRTVLRRVGAAGALSTGVGTAGAQNDSETESDVNRAVIPSVTEFQNEYVGQWLEINEETSADANVVENCDPAEWLADETQAYRGLLLDRRSESENAVELTILTERGDPGPPPDATYIIDEATECADDYVSLVLRMVQARSVAGKPPGPSAEEEDQAGGGGGQSGTPGFGVLAGLTALAAGALARAIGRRD